MRYLQLHAFLSCKMRNHFCNSNKILLLCILLYHIFMVSVSSASGNESDRLALLDLKSRVLNDPLGITRSWNDSTHFCDWVGVTCNSTIGRVVGLHLEARKLSGSIPSSLGNLTFLTQINLGTNNFHGHIPQEFGRLLQLRHLNLSANNFSGGIPSNISHCTKLVVLELSLNGLVGQIPHQLVTLTNLRLLGFGANNLIGTLPVWIGNFSSLLVLALSRNKFQGNIPHEFEQLTVLKYLAVSANNLSGTVPHSIYNITSLTALYLTANRLQGILPPNIGFTLPNLRFISGGYNNFSGPIPTSFANISGLRLLNFVDNKFTGTLPDDLGSLKDLETLGFENNRLGSERVDDLNFIHSLANCTRLRVLSLYNNRFGGTLPSSIGNLSNQLTVLILGMNKLSGSIPSGITNLINLQFLSLRSNYLNGSIPSNIGNLQNLVKLFLQGNQFTGSIPSSIGNLSSMSHLRMNDNKLEGSIPTILGQCKSLNVVDLAGNRLTGVIPKEILRLPSLTILLGLDYNSLTGSLPLEVGQLVHLLVLDVSKNQLSGDISTNLGKCVGMHYLDLSVNRFSETIPHSLEALQSLQILDLSSNNFSGPIPQFLAKIQPLTYLNLSYNNFEGKLPKEGIFSNPSRISILGNNNLCDGLPELHLPPCTSNQTHSSTKFLRPNVLIPLVSTITFTIILVGIIYMCCLLKKSKSHASTSSSSKDFLPQISYLELSKSTNGFSVENLIGSGSFGYVYKGILSNDGSIVAIKVLNLQQHGASKSFIDECNTLSNIRHRNLLKIITSCSSIDVQGNEFKAMVFNFMSNGNLDCWLHPANQVHNQGRILSLIERLNIAIDIACGLDYLHNHCETPIVHCDLKPSNILLDEDMVAHVGDFGLARFVLEESNNQSSFSQTMSLALKGSIGYIPPEYGTGSRISIEGDIFSYGILLLEMIIGKRPTDDTFSNGVDIHLFTTMTLPHGVMGIIDHSMLFEELRQEEESEERIQEIAIMSEKDRRELVPIWMKECLISVLGIGLSCSSVAPKERMPMNIVVNELQAIQSSYLKFKKTRKRYHIYLFP